MYFNAYGGNAALLAAALVNAASADRPDAAALEEILDTHRVARSSLSGRAAADLVAWGQRLRAVFVAGPVSEKVALLNALLGEVAARPFISTHDGLDPHLHYHPDGAPIAERVQATTAGGLASLLVDAGADRIGSCAAPDCAEVFIDVSRNGTRTYCSPRCATRVNVAAHRSRRGSGARVH